MFSCGAGNKVGVIKHYRRKGRSCVSKAPTLIVYTRRQEDAAERVSVTPLCGWPPTPSAPWPHNSFAVIDVWRRFARVGIVAGSAIGGNSGPGSDVTSSGSIGAILPLIVLDFIGQLTQ
jgi:hypothetical protein